jgi:hypothetical protein
MSRNVARWLFAVTAACVVVGVAIATVQAAQDENGYFTTASGRVFNVFCFFTVQSNLIVAVTSVLLAVDPDRRSTAFAVFRLAGVVDIVITGVVYHIALADQQDLEGSAAVANQLLHVVVPILAVVGWALYGPRGLVSWRIVGLATLIPLAWVAFTLVRGPIVDWYPYPFIDVIEIGYAQAIVNVVLVALVFVVLAAAAVTLDPRLPGEHRRPAPAAAA